MTRHWMRLSLLLLMAAPVEAGFTIDAGAADRRWHGSGTGSVMSDSYEGPLAAAGLLVIEVRDAAGAIVAPAALVAAIDLVSEGPGDVRSRRPAVRGGVALDRRIRLLDTGQARLFDEFINITGETLSVRLVWAGQSAHAVPLDSGPGLLGFTHRSGRFTIVTGDRASGQTVGTEMLPATGPFPGPDPSAWGVEYRFELRPGETRSLLLFVLEAQAAAGAGKSFAASARALQAAPDVSGLPPQALARAVNWGRGTGGGPVGQSATGVDVTRTSLAQLRAAVLDGRTSLRDLVRIYRGRIEAFDRNGPALNAFLAVNPDAEAEAERLDTLPAEAKAALPLLGTVIAIKDNIAVAGLPLTIGVHRLRDIRATADAPVVARLRTAGALIIGKTNIDELTSGVFGISGSGGQVLNAHDQGRAPSGSSSGSAVAVATRMAGAALGTDTWASILSPSADAGIVGIRPGEGVVPLDGVYPGHPRHDALGPMAAHAEDAALLLSVLADRPLAGLRAPAALRLGLIERPTAEPGARLARAPLLRTLGALRSSGAAIVAMPFDPTRHYAAVEQAMLAGDSSANQNAFIAGLPGIDTASVEAIVGGTDAVQASPRGLRSDFAADARNPPAPNTVADRQRHASAMARLRTALTTLMDRSDVDALVMETVLGPPALLGSWRSAEENSRFSAWSGLPAVTVPSGLLEGTAWPAGLLLVGRPGSEMELLAIAAEVERHVKRENRK